MKRNGGITFIRDISTDFFFAVFIVSYGSLSKLLITIGHCTSYNIFFKIAKRPSQGHGETVKFVCGPRIWFACSEKSIGL